MLYNTIFSTFVIFLQFSFSASRTPERLIGAREATDMEFPFAVFLYNKGESNNIICAGALIGLNWIITSAECTTKFVKNRGLVKLSNQMYIGAGELDATRGRSSYQTRLADQVVVHELFNPVSMMNNIALIRVKEQFFTAAERVKPLHISDKMSLGYLPTRQLFDNCTIVSWPTTKEETSNSLILKKLNVKLVGCEGKTANISDATHICAKDDYKNSDCAILGGAALVCDNSHPRLYGILHHRSHCNSTGPRKQLIFTKVSAHENWINKNFEVDSTTVPSDISAGSLLKNEAFFTWLTLSLVIIKLL